MATYNELRSLYGDGPLHDRIEVAVCMKAHAILAEETPSAERKAWALLALRSTAAEADWLMKYALAANVAFSLAQIQGATDAALLANVTTAVDKLYP